MEKQNSAVTEAATEIVNETVNETPNFQNAEKAFKEKKKRAPRVKVDDIAVLMDKNVKSLTINEARALVKELKQRVNCLEAQVILFKNNADSALQKAQNYEKAVDSINAQINAKNNAINAAVSTLINTIKLVNGGNL